MFVFLPICRSMRGSPEALETHADAKGKESRNFLADV